METVATKRTQFRDQYAVFSLAFSPDGTRLATSSPISEEVHVWSWQDHPRVVLTLNDGQGGGGSPNGLRFSPDGSLLASAHGVNQDDRIIRIWNTGTGAIAGDIAEHFGGSGSLQYAALAFAPDGRVLIRAQGGWHVEGTGTNHIFVDSFVVHDATTWQKVWGLKTEPVLPNTFAVSHDGRYAAITGDERRERNGTPYLQPKVLIVDLAERQVKQSIDVLADNRNFVAWSPDDRRILLGGAAVVVGTPPRKAVVEVIDAKTGREITEYAFTDLDAVAALMYSPDGRHLLIGWDTAMEIWDTEHTKLQQRIPGRTFAATFSSDGHYLVRSTGDGLTIDVWEMK